jgi:hypothetical protein
VGQTSRSLKVRYKEHIRYNNPKSAYAQHILRNQQEYGTMNNVMTLLKPLNNPNMLTHYEQLHIQALHQKGKLIPEQYAGDPNPLFQLAINAPIPLDRASRATSLSLDAHPAALQLTPDNQQPMYVRYIIFISITYLAPTQPRATH